MNKKLMELSEIGVNAMDYLNIAILIIDADFRVVFMNPMCEELLKLRKEDVLYKNIYEVHPDAPDDVRYIENTLKLGVTYKKDRMPYKFGDFNNFFNLETHLLKDDVGNVAGAMAEFTDVTEFVLNEQQLRKSLKEMATNIILLPERKGILPLNQAIVDILEVEDIVGDLLLHVSEKKCRMLIIDLSAIFEATNAFFHSLTILLKSLHLIGVKVSITGIKPEVATQMVQSGMNIDKITIYNSLEKAFN